MEARRDRCVLVRACRGRGNPPPWRPLPRGMVGEAGSRRDSPGISNGLLRVMSRLPSLFPADGSRKVWAHVAERKTRPAAEMFLASSDNPDKGAHQVPGSNAAAGARPRGLGEAVKGRGRPGCAGAWTKAPDCPLPLELAFGGHFSPCVAIQQPSGLVLTSRSYLQQ